MAAGVVPFYFPPIICNKLVIYNQTKRRFVPTCAPESRWLGLRSKGSGEPAPPRLATIRQEQHWRVQTRSDMQGGYRSCGGPTSWGTMGTEPDRGEFGGRG